MKKNLTLSGYKLPLIAVLGLVFAGVVILGRKPAPQKEPVAPPPSSSYTRQVSGIGIVEPKSETIAIGTELPGIVRTVHVSVGDHVKKGDPLFTLDQRDVQAQINTFKAALSLSKVQAEDAQAAFNLVKSLKDKQIISQDEWNKRDYALRMAVAKVAEIDAQLAQALTQKERLTTRAPINGQILSLDVRAGEYASSAGTTPLVRMGDTSTLHVRVDIDDELANKVKKGSRATGTLRGDTEHQLELTFVRIEPYVRPKQNLVVAGQRVDTRILQVVFAITSGNVTPFVGQQVDVYIERE